VDDIFSLTHFLAKFPDSSACLEEIRKLRFPEGIYCRVCKRITRHYKLKRGAVYACKFCRNQTHLLAETLFEKSTTPLRIWFFALFLMTYTRDGLSSKQLQKELGVTYKTAWRMHKNIRRLMEQNDGDLLKDTVDKANYREHRWVFFNKLEISWIEKREESGENN
jgi:transposase-like protein